MVRTYWIMHNLCIWKNIEAHLCSLKLRIYSYISVLLWSKASLFWVYKSCSKAFGRTDCMDVPGLEEPPVARLPPTQENTDTEMLQTYIHAMRVILYPQSQCSSSGRGYFVRHDNINWLLHFKKCVMERVKDHCIINGQTFTVSICGHNFRRWRYCWPTILYIHTRETPYFTVALNLHAIQRLSAMGNIIGLRFFFRILFN
jgi:hypothetical protein